MDANSLSSALDPHVLADRLQWERRGYWLHLDAASPLEKYPAKQHAHRVQQKLGADAGLIYLPGAPNRNIEDSDMPIRFRQRRYFYYLSGCNEPDCHLVYNIREDQLTLFLPRIDPRRVLYYGRGSTKTEALSKYDIDEVRYVDELKDFVLDWAKYHKGSVYFLHPSQNLFTAGLEGIVDSTSLQPAMDLARVIKDPHEIKLIKKANDISSVAHREVLANVRNFKNEAQVEGLFLNVCITKQAKEQAYDPIAASGPNAGTLHYAANNEDLEGRQLMCLDAGCEHELYASDITRTFPLTGSWPSKEAEQIYRLVERMQETCIERLAPGVRYLDIHILAHQIAIDGLLSLGILHNGSKEEIFKAGTSRAFFPHGLGHHVGLEVHDVGQADLMSMRKSDPSYEKARSLYPENFHLPVYDAESCMVPTDPQSGHLEEGMVVTVEPGIYFSTYLLKYFYYPSPIHSKYINKAVVQKYLPVGGVRIEDDILITSKGYENLTTAPKGDAMLEIIRGPNSQSSLPSELFGCDEREPKFSRKHSETEKLVRAPGIARNSLGPIQAPLARVQTLPVEEKDRKTYDFEPFDGPSLYTNFKRTSTIDNVAVQKVSKHSGSSRPQPRMSGIPVCGENSAEYEHTFMNMPGDRIPSRRSTDMQKPPCKSCSVLVQTLGRLRKNLSSSEHNSPVPESKPTFEKFGTKRMGIEPLNSGALRGLIDASVRPQEQEILAQKDPIPRHLTASPVSIEPRFSAPHELDRRASRRTSDNIADWLASASKRKESRSDPSLRSSAPKQSQETSVGVDSTINKTASNPAFTRNTERISNSNHSPYSTKPPRTESLPFPPPTTSCTGPSPHLVFAPKQAPPMNLQSKFLPSEIQSTENNTVKRSHSSHFQPRIFELPPPPCSQIIPVRQANPPISSNDGPLINLASEKPEKTHQIIKTETPDASKVTPWSFMSSVGQAPPPQTYPSQLSLTSQPGPPNQPQLFGHGQPQGYSMTCCGSNSRAPAKISKPPSMEDRLSNLRKLQERASMLCLEDPPVKAVEADNSQKPATPSGQVYNHSLAHYLAQLEALEEDNRIRRNKAGAEYKAANGLE